MINTRNTLGTGRPAKRSTTIMGLVLALAALALLASEAWADRTVVQPDQAATEWVAEQGSPLGS